MLTQKSYREKEKQKFSVHLLARSGRVYDIVEPGGRQESEASPGLLRGSEGPFLDFFFLGYYQTFHYYTFICGMILKVFVLPGVS